MVDRFMAAFQPPNNLPRGSVRYRRLVSAALAAAINGEEE
jgi:hypothetical protein